MKTEGEKQLIHIRCSEIPQVLLSSFLLPLRSFKGTVVETQVSCLAALMYFFF